MDELKLSPPWIIYYRKIEALFERDPEITIMFDDKKYVLQLRVTNAIKGYAIRKLLPKEVEFGNVVLNVIVDWEYSESEADLYKAAFLDNPVLSYVMHMENPAIGPVDYVVFEKEVAQYPNDDVVDINGICSTLYQDIARDIFIGNKRVKFCTDLGTPF